MNIRDKVKAILDEALALGGRSGGWTDDTALLGSLPELTSIAVVTVLLSLEEEFSIVFADDELDADTFATLGSLTRFIEGKLSVGAA
ncbi:MAG TPA: acyl carrier protein [Candidatus Binatia bacterium]|nr:acyl carrier protein [Candidatus Binatia bacterium]